MSKMYPKEIEIEEINKILEQLSSINNYKKIEELLDEGQSFFLGQLKNVWSLNAYRYCIKEMFIAYLQLRKNLNSNHKKLIDEIEKIVSRARVLGFIPRYVDSRVKSFDSIFRNWFKEFPKVETDTNPGSHFVNYLNNQYDFLGVRIVVLNLSDVVKVSRLILGNQSFGWNHKDLKNFYHSPQNSGYRSWQLKTDFYPDKKADSCIKCEIQVRTGLEDIWGEWEHEILYKKGPNISENSWLEWSNLLARECRELAHQTYQLAVRLDRQRELLEIFHRPLPVTITNFLKILATPDFELISNRIDPISHTKLLAANLVTGFDSIHLLVNFDHEGFIGLDIVDYNPPSKEKQKLPGSFIFEDLNELQESDSETKQFILVAEISKQKFPKISQKIQDDFVHLTSNPILSQNWKVFLRACFNGYKEIYPKNIGRNFFNEFQARLNSFTFKSQNDNPIDVDTLCLNIVKTNFAYEVCTHYLLDDERLKSIRNQNQNVGKQYEIVREQLLYLKNNGMFNIEKHGARSIGVHVNLITIDPATAERFLIVTQRGGDQTADNFEWQTSASGVACPKQSSIEWGGDIPGYVYDEEKPNAGLSFFLTAQRELFEELGVFVPIDHIRILALLDHRTSGQPILVAEAYTDKSLAEIKKLAQVAEESWEINYEEGTDPIQAIGIPHKEDLESFFLFQTNEELQKKKNILPSLLDEKNPWPRNKWQERSQMAIILSIFRQASINLSSGKAGFIGHFQSLDI